DGDVAAIVKFYLDKGHLDVRVSRQIQPSPDGHEAIVTFFIEEGSQYTLRSVSVERGGRRAPDQSPEPDVLSPDQIRGLLDLKPGDVIGAKRVEDAVRHVKDALRKEGYVDARVEWSQLRDASAPVVDLKIFVNEGKRFKTGMVYIQGNELTQQ